MGGGMIVVVKCREEEVVVKFMKKAGNMQLRRTNI
jgi:SOS-response transcriptional repressor LexA